jgi:hypothetical protein
VTSSRAFHDSVEKQHLVGRLMLGADHSLRQVGQQIVIRREPGAKVGTPFEFFNKIFHSAPGP